jgi:hypothetical protein
MFEHARRFRVLAALVVVLAVGQAWGQETIWTKAANLVCRAGRLPLAVKLKRKVEAHQPPPIFSWEKQDDAEWYLTLAQMYEADGFPEIAYAEYKWLCRRFPGEKRFSAAAARLKAKLEAEYHNCQSDCPSGIWDGSDWGLAVIEVEEVLDRLQQADKDQPGKLERIAPMSDFLGGTTTGDTPDGDLALALAVINRALEDDQGRTLCDWEGPLSGHPNRKRSVSPFTAAWMSHTTAPTLPERKDMLPDSDYSKLLTELGVIPDANQLLALTPKAADDTFLGTGFWH